MLAITCNERLDVTVAIQCHMSTQQEREGGDFVVSAVVAQESEPRPPEVIPHPSDRIQKVRGSIH